MTLEEQNMNKGISLRTIHALLVIVALVVSCMMFYSTRQMSKSYEITASSSKEHVELRKAAMELMDASDYLTEKVQRFTVDGNTAFMNEYFYEAFQLNRREEAIIKMAQGRSNSAIKALMEAMDSSVILMRREYYAMRLVVEAKGYTEYPSELNSVELSKRDLGLSPEAKMRLATEMVLDSEYFKRKDRIRAKVKNIMEELELTANETDRRTRDSFNKEISVVWIVIALQVTGIFFLVWLTSRLGINPVLNAVDRIKSNSPIPEVGANEFRYLARAYNKMYEVYKSSLERLNFEVSHDPLTGAYNRAGYELIASSLDIRSTYMLLFDVDDFKSINDTYGHDVGDKVLIKLVNVLKRYFRSDDYICRIGGDEFVVFMVHMNEKQNSLVTGKLKSISDALSEDDGLPKVTVSVGVTHGTDVKGRDSIFEMSDRAMYKAKQNGKNKFTFVDSRQDENGQDGDFQEGKRQS